MDAGRRDSPKLARQSQSRPAEANFGTLGDRDLFFDHQATTPLDPLVLDAMLPFFGARFGNPHSVGYGRAEAARAAVALARSQVAGLINAYSSDVILTSGATEATNIALRGLCAGRPGHLVVSAIEHACVRETARALAASGVDLTELPVDADGLVDPEELATSLRGDTLLVSIIMANNEIGTIQPVAELGAICRLHGVPFHVDAAQAVGRIPVDVEAMGIDLLSASSHKLYGPQGVGALFCRSEVRVRLQPILTGGGQEGGLRPGTLPLALVVGFGEACRLAGETMAGEGERVANLRSRLLAGLREAAPPFVVNGTLDQRLPGNLSIGFHGIDGDALVACLPDVAISTGSACSSAAVEPSHVLAALGLDRETIMGSIRIGLGRGTSLADVDAAVIRIASAAHRLARG